MQLEIMSRLHRCHDNDESNYVDEDEKDDENEDEGEDEDEDEDEEEDEDEDEDEDEEKSGESGRIRETRMTTTI